MSNNPAFKKLRFRGDSDNRIEDIFDDNEKRKSKNDNETSSGSNRNIKQGTPSFGDFLKIELSRGYILEHDEERYSARREKLYSFFKIPSELEKIMYYGLIQCADSFLYIHTFLPIRYILALWAFITRSIANLFGLKFRTYKILTPAEICDLLKGSIWIFCTLIMLLIDTNRVYHIIKTQSIIKLYIFYNMLDVGDRLLSAFGQDAIDSLFWTATEPKNRTRDHYGLITHIAFTSIYVLFHSFMIMFQATTLNVALNSNNKGLLMIMISNNFVELKSSVFKKFDKNNLFQLTCSDIRERFHLSILLFIVSIQTMKEFNWSYGQFYILLVDCFYVLFTEVLIDWIKHAFITRFNEIPIDVYREYTTSLAYDMTQTRQKHAFSDHSDLVGRRMGFIPFPLGVVLIKAIYSAISFNNVASFIIFIIIYITLICIRILITICALGKACDLMKQHQNEKQLIISTNNCNNINVNKTIITNITNNNKNCNLNQNNEQIKKLPTTSILQRSNTIDISTMNNIDNYSDCLNITNFNECNELNPDTTLSLGATALFSNSDVDLDDVCLNENILNSTTNNDEKFENDTQVTRSVPDLQQKQLTENKTELNETKSIIRTHKRSESEPSIQSILPDKENNQTL